MKYLFLILLMNIFRVLGQQPSITCNYLISTNNEYTCRMEIYNPSGLNNFREVNGTHLENMSSSDVIRIEIFGSTRNTLNFPSIICLTFTNVVTIDFTRAEIQRIDAGSFKRCTILEVLFLDSNRISHINEDAFFNNRELRILHFSHNQLIEVPENTFVHLHQLIRLSLTGNNISDFADNTFKSLTSLETLNLAKTRITKLRSSWFETLENLQILWIYENSIDDFPEGIFAPLKNMWLLTAFHMNLTVIHSSSFGPLPRLNSVDFHANQIDAFDEKFMDNTDVGTLDMMSNVCANDWMSDNKPSRETLRATMRICFENYRRLVNAALFVAIKNMSSWFRDSTGNLSFFESCAV
ncbi:carboxypeptidase N subunit 2-like isoform X2 [Chironomus tepperi]|uniref:carboxypeptidase N subunit 2-like isoform X2 n=1 Tax=Chironomus tepperi TaxID=113505 RepID=UPI00391F5F09